MVYNYSNRPIEPDLDKLHFDVASSLMSDKSIEWCRWDEEEAHLEVVFTNELSVEDKDLLDIIVAGA